MQVMEENEDIAFLYHLVEGYAESSLACHIASLAGLPDELVERAHQVCRKTEMFVQRRNVDTTILYFDTTIPCFPKNVAQTMFVICKGSG